MSKAEIIAKKTQEQLFNGYLNNKYIDLILERYICMFFYEYKKKYNTRQSVLGSPSSVSTKLI